MSARPASRETISTLLLGLSGIGFLVSFIDGYLLGVVGFGLVAILQILIEILAAVRRAAVHTVSADEAARLVAQGMRRRAELS